MTERETSQGDVKLAELRSQMLRLVAEQKLINRCLKVGGKVKISPATGNVNFQLNGYRYRLGMDQYTKLVGMVANRLFA